MSDDPSQAAQEAVEHLRAAALELIAAARAILDLTEDLVKDPGPLLALASTLSAMGAHSAHSAHTADHSGPTDAPRPRVKHIKVS